MNDNKRERKAAYTEAVEQYKLPVAVLTKIHNTSAAKVDIWLNDAEVCPSFEVLYELNHFLKRLKLAPPQGLNKVLNRSIYRINDYVSRLDESPVDGSALNREIRKPRNETSIYIYQGESIALKDIREKLNLTISRNTIRKRIKDAGVQMGESIDDVDFKHSNTGKKPDFFVYEGKKVTRNDIANDANFSINKVGELLKGFSDGDDITEVINQAIIEPAKARIKNMNL